VEALAVIVTVIVAVVIVGLFLAVSARAAPTPSHWPLRARPYEGMVREAARRYGVDPALVAAVCETESNWDPSAVNPSDPSYGIMQVMIPTAREVRPGTTQSELLDPAVGIMVGTAYIARLRDHYRIPMPDGIDAYNIGPGAWKTGRRNIRYRALVLDAMGRYS